MSNCLLLKTNLFDDVVASIGFTLVAMLGAMWSFPSLVNKISPTLVDVIAHSVKTWRTVFVVARK